MPDLPLNLPPPRQPGLRREDSWLAILFADGQPRLGWLTLALALLAILATACSGFDFTSPYAEKFYITQVVKIDGGVGWKSGLPEICSGQVWRLWSTFFLHTSWFHLATNVFWLLLLGSFVEKRRGPLALAAMVFVCVPLINLFQYAVHGPFNTGMSGTTCFLFAYLSVRGFLSPKLRLGKFRYALWFFGAEMALRYTGLMGTEGWPAHAAGMVLGSGWAVIDAPVDRWTKKKGTVSAFDSAPTPRTQGGKSSG